jgi:TetR/AcrR family transcriptional regulator
MPRRRAVSYDTKLEHIRDTAAGLFARDGFSRTSMAELAATCGVSKALLYHYFDSKEALLFDILQAYLRDLEKVVEIDGTTAANARDHLRDLIGALLRQYREAGNTH